MTTETPPVYQVQAVLRGIIIEEFSHSVSLVLTHGKELYLLEWRHDGCTISLHVDHVHEIGKTIHRLKEAFIVSLRTFSPLFGKNNFPLEIDGKYLYEQIKAKFVSLSENPFDAGRFKLVMKTNEKMFDGVVHSYSYESRGKRYSSGDLSDLVKKHEIGLITPIVEIEYVPLAPVSAPAPAPAPEPVQHIKKEPSFTRSLDVKGNDSDSNPDSEVETIAGPIITAENPPTTAKKIRLSKSDEKPVRKCIMCMSEKATHVTVPCGHLCACKGCSVVILKTKKCPVCKRHIDLMIRLHCVDDDEVEDIDDKDDEEKKDKPLSSTENGKISLSPDNKLEAWLIWGTQLLSDEYIFAAMDKRRTPLTIKITQRSVHICVSNNDKISWKTGDNIYIFHAAVKIIVECPMSADGRGFLSLDNQKFSKSFLTAFNNPSSSKINWKNPYCLPSIKFNSLPTKKISWERQTTDAQIPTIFLESRNSMIFTLQSVLCEDAINSINFN